MQDTRDQVDAYKFMQKRVRRATFFGDPEARQLPLKRSNLGLVIGTALSLLGILAVVLANKFWPQPTVPQEGVVIDSASGARYLMVSGLLHPLENITSARIVLKGQVKTSSESGKLITEIPRGLRMGIPGAPEDIPAAKDLDQQGWKVCSGPAESPFDPPTVTVTLGPEATKFSDDLRADAVLVTDPDSKKYLIAGDTRYLISD